MVHCGSTGREPAGCQMWSQATRNHMSLLDLPQSGWRIVDGKLECDWEFCRSYSKCTSAPDTQQGDPIELVEVEEEELLHDSIHRDAYGEEWVEGRWVG